MERQHVVIWSGLAFMSVSGIVGQLLTSAVPWRSEVVAAWVQAVGSIVAIFAAIGVAAWQSHADRLRQDHEHEVARLQRFKERNWKVNAGRALAFGTRRQVEAMAARFDPVPDELVMLELAGAADACEAWMTRAAGVDCTGLYAEHFHLIGQIYDYWAQLRMQMRLTAGLLSDKRIAGNEQDAANAARQILLNSLEPLGKLEAELDEMVNSTFKEAAEVNAAMARRFRGRSALQPEA